MKRSILTDILLVMGDSSDAKPIADSLQHIAMATAVLCAAVVFGGRPANADTQVFKDMLHLRGVERSQAQKFADGRACGASANNTFTNAPAFQKCMRARGWALDRIVSDDPPTWIDPDTGLECHSAGIVAVCDPPSGTTTYVNKHGYPCRRSGVVSVWTNL